MSIVEKIKSYPKLKQFALWMLQPTYRPRPRLWVKLFLNPLMHTKSWSAFVSGRTRMDVFPFNKFELGAYSTVEDFACVNNAMGDVVIGSKSRIGIGNTVIGPVTIGDNINIAQNVVMSGLNHEYQFVSIPPREQACSTSEIIIENDCWIGANAVITAGVKLGKHVIVAAGSVVTKSVPSYSVVAGVPAKVIKSFNAATGCWEKVSNTNVKKRRWANLM